MFPAVRDAQHGQLCEPDLTRCVTPHAVCRDDGSNAGNQRCLCPEVGYVDAELDDATVVCGEN